MIPSEIKKRSFERLVFSLLLGLSDVNYFTIDSRYLHQPQTHLVYLRYLAI